MSWREARAKREIASSIGVEYNEYIHAAFFVVIYDRYFAEWRVGGTADSLTEAKRDYAFYKRNDSGGTKVFILPRASVVRTFCRVIGGSGRLVKRKHK